ncbi:MAG: hypothetical protein KGI51_11560, partial [Rhodospirillales bacterium]|nr:hypothetical protein [Rhodospirillales bacterium]
PPPRPWSAPPRARVTPVGYRPPPRSYAAPAYRPAPPPGGSMLGMAPGFTAAPPAPMPMHGAGFGGG